MKHKIISLRDLIQWNKVELVEKLIKKLGSFEEATNWLKGGR